MNKTWVLCDGNVEECKKSECYKFGVECRHTCNINNVIDPPKNRRSITNVKGDYWGRIE